MRMLSEGHPLAGNRMQGATQLLLFTIQVGARVGSSVEFFTESMWEFKHKREKDRERKITGIFKIQPQGNYKVNKLIL